MPADNFPPRPDSVDTDREPSCDIRVGTCGWSYDGWRGHFYPQHLPAQQRLEHYSRYFDSVEVDSTFYSAPPSQVAGQWLDATPETFLFAAKVSREITHDRKLRECEALLTDFLGCMAPLHRKLACVLLQLPPYFVLKHDEQALREFVQRLPADFRFAIEFRDPSWHLPRIVHLLEEHRICWVWNDITSYENAQEAAFGFLPQTTDFLYVRLLGEFESAGSPESPGAAAFELAFPRDASIESWAVKVQQHRASCVRALIYSTNQFEGFAAGTAQRVAKHFGKRIELPTTEELQGEAPEAKQQLDLL